MHEPGGGIIVTGEHRDLRARLPRGTQIVERELRLKRGGHCGHYMLIGAKAMLGNRVSELGERSAPNGQTFNVDWANVQRSTLNFQMENAGDARAKT
jgi:hypothetical protein